MALEMTVWLGHAGLFVQSAIGGGLIGAASAALLMLNGRIAGISGILGDVIGGAIDSWRWAFLLGLLAAALVVLAAGLPTGQPVFGARPPLYLIGGALVGIGTGVGSGCTSGHGVCGLANLSLRSLVATLLFMGTAAVTVFMVRHVVG